MGTIVKRIKGLVGISPTIAKCGHEMPGCEDKVYAFGEHVTTTIRPNKDGSFDYCHRCLEKMAVRCVWCGRPIFVGDVVTLYSPKDDNNFEEMKKRPNVVVHNEELRQFVGCGRVTCADTGMDYCGTWVPPGMVLRYRSGLEKFMDTPGAQMVMSNDLSDPRNTEVL